jgi:glyoxylase-like metal-dependent hydrolase (beta-lactamase superfamily II)
MSEPTAVADHVEEVVPSVSSWRVQDDRIGGYLSSAHALAGPEGTILIDPLPLEDESLQDLGPVSAIVITSGGHQRSAWRYRRELRAPVYAPALSREIDEEPDERYGDGDSLPGGLTAYFTPGAGTTQHTLLTSGDPGVAFVPDLLVKMPGLDLMLTPAEYVHDPELQRESVERLLGLPFTVLCLSHGVPVVDDPQTAIRAALAA